MIRVNSKNLQLEFITNEIKKICNQNKVIDMFKDYDRSNDFFGSVMWTVRP